jgi:hypothetical protein
MKTRWIRLAAAGLAAALVCLAQEKVDLEAIYRIKQEAFQNSKVMDHLFQLTDVNGPRLAGSPEYKRSADWAVKTMKDWGIDGARLEKWGTFGKGWSNQKYVATMVEPTYTPLIGFPLAWTKSTDGVVSAEAVYAPLRSEEDLAKWKGQLKGKIVLYEPMRELALRDKPLSERYSEKELEEIEMSPVPGEQRRLGAPQGPGQMSFQQMMALRKKREAFLREEGVALLVSAGQRGDGGTVFGQSGGSRDPKDPEAPAAIVITPEQYNRIARLLEKKVPVRIEAEIRNAFHEPDANNFNVIAEIPGTGPHKDEVVMIGGHLDSWHGGTGATDNATGVAVMMEAMRILKKLNLKMDRTVRIGLWDAEEQGLLGSRGYVKNTFADRETMKTTKEWEKFCAYYNIDNGAGKIRGIYLQGNEMLRPVFESWLAPFKDLGVTTVTIRNTSGTDHQSFDAVGLPGFQFIQDELEYSTRTHHSNMDVYDRVPRGDMMQMTAVVTSLVYHTANRPEKLPRKPKPEPRPAGSGGPMSF